MIDLKDDDTVWWQGWRSDWKALRATGWVVSFKPKYFNVAQPKDSAAANEYIYIRHPISKQMGRININAQNASCGYYELEFLMQERNNRVRPPKILSERGLFSEDIPRLMELILQLQPKRKRQIFPVNKTQAEILLMKSA